MTNAQILLDKYRELEYLIQQKEAIPYDKSPVKAIEDMEKYRGIRNKLYCIRETRNFLTHKLQINGKYVIEPTLELIEMVDNVIDFINYQPNAYDKCIKVKDVCFAKKEDLICDYMLKMKNNTYTHIPILEDGVVQGVFSENTLFGILLENEIIDIKDIKFDDELIKKHCKLENHVSEMFLFIDRNKDMEEVKELFEKSFVNNQRLAMLFITQTGKSTEKLLGILTPWDVLSK